MLHPATSHVTRGLVSSAWRRIRMGSAAGKGLLLLALFGLGMLGAPLGHASAETTVTKSISCNDLQKRCLARVDQLDAVIQRSPGLPRPARGDSEISRARCVTDYQTAQSTGRWPGTNGLPGLSCVP